MTPVDTYTAQATIGDVKKGMENHKNLESSDTALLVFGNGDGGGGPLNKMLENLRRIRAVTNTHRELPPVSMGSSVDDFFVDLEKTSGEGRKLPNWHGELYLEFHRGTYTSHGSIKKGNRHSEVLLRDVELLASLASVSGREGYVYPKSEIDECWEKVLLNQFHDVLPGSSIGMVYEDAEKLYAEVKSTGEALLEEALSVLFPSSASLSPSPALQSSKAYLRALAASTKLVAFNTTFFPRVEVVKVPLSKMSKEVKSMVLQASDDGKEGYAVVACTEGAAVGEIVSPSNRLRSKLMPVSVYTNGSDHFVLRNSSVQLTISDGRITSLLDVKTDRELIAKGQTGGLVIFQDRPNYWDAWDVEIHHLEVSEQLKFENVSVVSQGPVFGSVRAEVKYGDSTIVITISLAATGATTREGSRSLFNFDAQVDWHQRHEFLKFELPLDIHSDHATYETQFGHLQRPTHKNTTWDMAKFEVCGHKFADLSEFGYGVAILSESKYGFSCLGNVLRISLLRGATAPDAEQDQGEHAFSWGVYPHVGGFLESDVPVAGFLYNSPVRVRALPPSPANAVTHHAPFAIEGSRNVFLETVKRGEDDSFHDAVNLEDIEDFTSHKKGKSNLVLRLYEAYGGHGTVALKVSRHVPVVKAFITNLLEDHEEELDIEKIREQDKSSLTISDYEGGARITLKFRGFEVKTVKLVLGKVDDDSASGLESEEESAPTYPPPPAEKRGRRSSWVDVDEDQLAL
ncbi:hypothetical protein NMY22_g15114 [Coprinellus aureogranulatus]|nr:hypothetical protein NMY22_g15114 [Coprinellus aureogranulatus]